MINLVKNRVHSFLSAMHVLCDCSSIEIRHKTKNMLIRFDFREAKILLLRINKETQMIA